MKCKHEETCRDFKVSVHRIVCANCGMDLYQIIGDFRAEVERLQKENDALRQEHSSEVLAQVRQIDSEWARKEDTPETLALASLAWAQIEKMEKTGQLEGCRDIGDLHKAIVMEMQNGHTTS